MKSNFELIFDPTAPERHICQEPTPSTIPDELPWTEGVVIKCTICGMYWSMFRDQLTGYLEWFPHKELLEALGKL
jgi:hypothetical protein